MSALLPEPCRGSPATRASRYSRRTLLTSTSAAKPFPSLSSLFQPSWHSAAHRGRQPSTPLAPRSPCGATRAAGSLSAPYLAARRAAGCEQARGGFWRLPRLEPALGAGWEANFPCQASLQKTLQPCLRAAGKCRVFSSQAHTLVSWQILLARKPV